MKKTFKSLIICGVLASSSLMAQQVEQNAPNSSLTVDATTKVKAISTDIVKCASAKAPQGTEKVQVELYPLPDNKGQILTLAIDKNNQPTPIAPCDINQLATSMSGLFPYLKPEEGKQYAGYLFVSTLDAENIVVRLITAEEYQKAIAAAPKK